MIRYLSLFLILFYCQLYYGQNTTVEDVYIVGNKKLKTAFVKKISSVTSGEKLDSVSIEKDILRLKRLPSVANAFYKVEKSIDNKYKVYYHIQENFTLIPSISIYTTDDDEFAYRLGLNEFNFLGRNLSIGAFYQKDIYDSYSLNFRAPYLFSQHLGLALNYQNLTTQEPVFFSEGTAHYKYNNTSYEALGLYQINFKNRIELGLNYFIEDYTFNGENVESRPELNVDKWLLKAIYDYNGLDYFFHYISGFRSQLNFQYVTSTDSMLPDFYIVWNDFFYYKRSGDKGNWANRLRLGLSQNDESPFAPFSVDNNLNMRGVGNTIDRGTGVIVLNSEYRYSFYERENFVIQSNIFIDAGTWRNPGGDFGDFGESQNLRIYPGLGLRFILKKIYNATFRIDYGIGITPDATQGLVFGIGQYF